MLAMGIKSGPLMTTSAIADLFGWPEISVPTSWVESKKASENQGTRACHFLIRLVGFVLEPLNDAGVAKLSSTPQTSLQGIKGLGFPYNEVLGRMIDCFLEDVAIYATGQVGFHFISDENVFFGSIVCRAFERKNVGSRCGDVANSLGLIAKTRHPEFQPMF